MYYPYLRARQFELIAIRELLQETASLDKIFPVLEPIKEEVGNLNIAHNKMQEYDFHCFLIINPQVGKTKKDLNYFLNYISELDNCKFIPAFIYVDNGDYIKESIQQYNIDKCMIIGLDSFSNEEEFKELCTHQSINDIMILDPGKFRGIDRFVKSLGKNYIRLDDLFEKQSKNADYLEIPAHKFSEEHLYFLDERYSGFSDFTTLPSEYVEGGSTPRAVVIHFTYLNVEEGNQIWIRHFTSEENDTIANVQGKFAKAAEKTLIFCNEQDFSNSAIEELRRYFNEQKYPGLGTVKKISIKNHLLVINSFLNND